MIPATGRIRRALTQIELARVVNWMWEPESSRRSFITTASRFAADCHHHIYDSRFPVDPSSRLRPGNATFDLLAQWCQNKALRMRILVDNPAHLYGFS
jgi:predicted TIM-barrel fold metal-dependent hydrolase